MARRSLIALSLGIVVGGCGHHQPRQPSAAELAAVKPAQWKAVIRDAYDGHIDRRHSCAAVTVAIEHLPVDMIDCGACLELRAYEKKIC